MTPETPSSSPPPAGGAAPAPPHLPDYQLLRLIGRGSYGEVWLARGVTGIYRAIKIVRRASFNEAGPFEREFKGLKEFASISLGESVQLALLHVGRDDPAGFFYYVMELADDVERGRDIDPATYAPLTLAELREKRGRLPASDCVRFGVELARVLAGLHARKLVHRDIKPSNVILVGGVPKLADIGLVAPTSTVLTFVGTEGFVPPEGPGRPGADVYALGKVLYELSTGLDRQEFPQLPPDVARLPDHGLLLEVNEIILRACESNPSQRYADGAAILADLRALQDGSLVQSRRRRSLFQRAGIAALAAAVIGAGIWWWERPARLAPPAAAPATGTPVVISPRSVAVLPFENYSDEKANAYFADGVYDDILTNLANLSSLRVIARTSMLQYRATTKPIKQIAAELGVAYVLEGSVRRAGNKIRVTGQLIRAATEEQVWAKAYDRDLTDIFAIQSELAHEIATALSGVLTAGEESRLANPPTHSIEAYDLVQRARSLEGIIGDPVKLGRAQLPLYEQAVKLDPNYAEAWAGVAHASMNIASEGPTDDAEGMAKARAALARAEQLDPDNYVVLMAGANLGAMTGDRALVNQRRQRITELFPNRAEARFVAGLTATYEARWADALAAFRLARELDPHNPAMLGNLENLLISFRYFDEYASVLRGHRALQPDLRDVSLELAAMPFYQSGTTDPLKDFLAGLPPNPDFANRELLTFQVQGLAMLGDAAGLVRLKREAGSRWVVGRMGDFENMVVALAFHAVNDPESARPLVERVRDQAQDEIAAHANYLPAWNRLGLCQAMLGDKAAARASLAHLRELVRRAGPLPEARKDNALFDNSVARAWVGEKAEAVAGMAPLFRRVLTNRHALVHALRTSLFTAPLRGDAAFEAMLNDPANNAPVNLDSLAGNLPAPTPGNHNEHVR